MKNETEKAALDPPVRARRPNSREVSSRYNLSPTSAESGIPSPPNRAISPTRRMNGNRKDSSLIRVPWPSATSSDKKSSTLADHLGNERLIDFIERKSGDNTASFGRQRSSSEFNRFEKENRPIGGSMRYALPFRIPSKSPSSSSSSPASSDQKLPPRRKPHTLVADILNSESDCTDLFSATDFGSPLIGKTSSSSSLSTSSSSYFSSATTSAPKSGIQTKSLRDLTSRTRHSSDSIVPTREINSPNLIPKNAIKRSNSVTAYGLATSQWALSPGRTLSPPISGESNGKPLQSFSNLRPPSPGRSKGKGMGNLLSLGFELFKSKKSPTSSSSSTLSSLMIGAAPYQLGILHNRLLQWRFVNARAEAVNWNKSAEAERNFLNAWATLSNLQSSMVRKHTQLAKENLELKLNRVLNSQVKQLEAWADMERQHLSAVSMTKDCIHSVVCRVPLTEGAKADSQPISVVLHHAADLTLSINTTINNLSPMAQKTVPLLSELAEVAAREKSLLHECFELLGVAANLELKQRSLRCQIIQLRTEQQHQLQQEAV
ncbi:uncharacterized protein LOC143854054 [Tasmannia lanceolata]|uniref:uncharacterized protein LOC143854054 n=1 Tax=Tasmannia lanceolata TaxID=3420 RepID=UPI0040641028